MSALWRQAWINATRVTGVPNFSRVVVAVDPPTRFECDEGDPAGIVAVGLHDDGRAYVIADRTCGGNPSIWVKAVVSAFVELKAHVVVTDHYARDMVASLVRQATPDIPVKTVHARGGKYMRAEPLAAGYAEGRIVHCGHFPDLDALLLALPELMQPAQTPWLKVI